MKKRAKKGGVFRGAATFAAAATVMAGLLSFAPAVSAVTCPVQNAFDVKTFKPCMAVPIPTVKFSTIQITKTTVNGDTSTEAIDVPWLAQFVGGIYEYAIGVAVLLAGVMVLVGGIQYVTAGGNASKAGAAKKRITDAIVGLLLVFGAWIILNTINTELVKPKHLVVSTVKGQPWYIKQVPPATYQKLTGQPPAARAAIMQMAAEEAEKAGVDKCMVTEIVRGESGGSPTAIGHDENFLGTGVGSRIAFFRNGTLYSGGPIGCSGERNANCRNDDQKDADPMSPPDYGLDKRYTHGIGIGQLTIGAISKNIRCPDGNMGINWPDHTCSTVADLLDPRKNIQASIKYLIKNSIANCGGNPVCVFFHYAGGGCSARMSACIKSKYYTACSGKGFSELPNCFDWTTPYTPAKGDSPAEVKRKRKCCSSVTWHDIVPPDPSTCGN